jgi:hypothetical protein
MAKTVSDKSTKTEILEAYNEMLARSKEQKASDQKAVKKEAEEKETVKTASQNSVEEIVKKLAGLKLEIVKSVDSLEEKLLSEYRRFTDLQQAIAVQSAALEEMYGIQPEAGSLSALILAQREKKAAFEDEMEETRTAFEDEIKEKKAAFDADMTQRKTQWKKEQDDFEFSKKERDAQLKKERQREEEDYTYNLQLQRKKESDAYEAKKATLEKDLTEKKARVEKDLAEREASVVAREKETDDLRIRVDTFPKELEKAVKETEKTVTERLEFKYKYQAELTAKEIAGEERLNKQIISDLQRKIGEQEEQIRQLTQKADDSVQQVQTIAVKAIEGASASTQRIFTERGKETA